MTSVDDLEIKIQMFEYILTLSLSLMNSLAS